MDRKGANAVIWSSVRAVGSFWKSLRALEVSMMLNSAALASAPRGLPENRQFFRHSTNGRIAPSHALVSGVSTG